MNLTEKQIADGNAAIAEYMQFKIKEGKWTESFTGWYIVPDTFPLNKSHLRPEHLQFDSSMDWLYPVLQQIKKEVPVMSVLDMDKEAEKAYSIFDLSVFTPIETVWACAVEYIRWRKENSKRYKVTISLVVNPSRDSERPVPETKQLTFEVYAGNEAAAIAKAKELETSNLSVWESYAEEIK